MIITSDFKDYYDSVSSYGVDTTCRYNRRMAKATRKDCGDVKLPEFSSSLKHLVRVVNAALNSGNDRKYFSPKELLYCGGVILAGKMYPQLLWSPEGWDTPIPKWADPGTKKVLTPAQMVPLYEKMQEAYASLVDKEIWRGYLGYEKVPNYGSLEQLIAKATSVYEVGNELLIKLGVPVLCLLPAAEGKRRGGKEYHYTYSPHGSFVRDEKTWYETTVAVVNPKLEDLDMVRKLHPYQAFMDIANFVSGVMGGQSPPMVEVSDKIRLEKHGFDAKHSFRPKMKR